MMGLQGVLATVVATETSPVIRGHLNSYPLVANTADPNNGSWPWWRTPVSNTEAEFDAIRSAYGSFVLQVNHPISLGMADLAGWAPGEVARGDFWSSDFDAMELANGGGYDRYFDLWVDLVNRGLIFTPTGVTDGHGPFGSGFGVNGTWFHLGVDDPAEYTDEALRTTMRQGAVVVSRGVHLLTEPLPGSLVAAGTELQVEARSASWAAVDRVELLLNGQVVATEEGPGPHVFSLSPDADGWYAVAASGDTSMWPVYDTTPWAITNAIYVDVDGDGWQAPMGPLDIQASSEFPPAELFDAHAAHHGLEVAPE